MNQDDQDRDVLASWAYKAHFWLCLTSAVACGYFGPAAKITYNAACLAAAAAPLVFVVFPGTRLFAFALMPILGIHEAHGIKHLIHGNALLGSLTIAYFAAAAVLAFRRDILANRCQSNVMVGRLEGSTPAAVNSRFFKAAAARHTFAAVVGMEAIKQSLAEKVLEIASKKHGDTVRNGILLSGDPGNGKTFFAEALAGEFNLPFLAVSYGELASKWVNQTTENVVALFESARQQAPCVLFIDEIDSLIPDRGAITNADSETARTVNTVLTALVEIRGSGVIVIAATNFLDKLDTAAVRDGRFDFKMEVPPPDLPARKHLIAVGLNKLAPQLPVDRGVVDLAAVRWRGFSVARIDAVVKEIGVQARQGVIRKVDLGVLQAALRVVQGRKGSLPENALGLADLELEPVQKAKLISVVARMRRIEEVEKLGGTVPAGILFHGDAGTGKTSAAMALAKETGWAFLAVAGNDLLGDPSKIDRLLQEASDIRPCIVFIDEADDILADRRNSAARTVTNKLLIAMDGAAGKTPDVVFVAATNHPEELDAAALRGGRFTEKIEFLLPTADVVTNFVHKWLASKKASLTAPMSAEAIGARLEGVSIANVEAVMQAALNTIVGRKLAGETVHGIGHSDFQAALGTVLGH